MTPPPFSTVPPPGGDGDREGGVGAWLRSERLARHLTLEELAQTTRIPMKNLQLLEEDRFDELPAEVFTRGFLRAYARALGVSPDAVLARHDLARGERPEEVAPRLPVAPAERGSGFGIAIALVILLVLFTLALSIVLRPRRRDVPVELSRAPLVVPLDAAAGARADAPRAG